MAHAAEDGIEGVAREEVMSTRKLRGQKSARCER